MRRTLNSLLAGNLDEFSVPDIDEIERGKNAKLSASRWAAALEAVRKGMANQTGLEICVAHYAPYCSKHNPIEHRVFPHVTRACEGMILKSVDVVKSLIERTTTRTGLSVTVDILSQSYEAGRKAVEHLKSNIQLVNDTILPRFNYTISPAY